MADQAVRPEGITFRRWECGESIGFTDLSPSFATTCGAPYYVAHRSHLRSALLRTAQKLGVMIMLNSRVIHHDPDLPSITLEDGQVFEADLVIAADGE
jgi:salicylate hydroxylase